MKLTFAFCTYNRVDRLGGLVAAMRSQNCPVPFEILAVNNNSQDRTLAVLEDLANQPGVSLRYVTETEPGIVPARNRAIRETLESDILVFIDDDELPRAGLLDAAYDAIVNEGAQCVGGRVEVDFGALGRPTWLTDELLGFLAEVNYSEAPFWIGDTTTPIWTANIAYDTCLFREEPLLRFDGRYNRKGDGVGGGEDEIMFRALLSRGARIRYRPDMVVGHSVEPWRLTRRYFFRLRYNAGVRYGRYELGEFERTILGVPFFLVRQMIRQVGRAGIMFLWRDERAMRQAMNAAHTVGTIIGRIYRWRANEAKTVL